MITLIYVLFRFPSTVFPSYKNNYSHQKRQCFIVSLAESLTCKTLGRYDNVDATLLQVAI